jgi:hypothetical protein
MSESHADRIELGQVAGTGQPLMYRERGSDGPWTAAPGGQSVACAIVFDEDAPAAAREPYLVSARRTALHGVRDRDYPPRRTIKPDLAEVLRARAAADIVAARTLTARAVQGSAWPPEC